MSNSFRELTDKMSEINKKKAEEKLRELLTTLIKADKQKLRLKIDI